MDTKQKSPFATELDYDTFTAPKIKVSERCMGIIIIIVVIYDAPKRTLKIYRENVLLSFLASAPISCISPKIIRFLHGHSPSIIVIPLALSPRLGDIHSQSKHAAICYWRREYSPHHVFSRYLHCASRSPFFLSICSSFSLQVLPPFLSLSLSIYIYICIYIYMYIFLCAPVLACFSRNVYPGLPSALHPFAF